MKNNATIPYLGGVNTYQRVTKTRHPLNRGNPVERPKLTVKMFKILTTFDTFKI